MAETGEPSAAGPGPHLSFRRERLLRGSDFREAALLAAALGVVKLGTPSLWAATADRMARVGFSRRRGRFRRFLRNVEAFYGADGAEERAVALWRAINAAMIRRRFATVAEWSRVAFEPRIDIEGAEHIHEALHRGRGVILWFDNFINHQVLGKRGVFQAGFKGWHPSWTKHGFSASRIGRRVLNPVQIGAEARYIDGRIEFDARSALGATRRVTELLAANAVVQITNNAYIGRKFVPAPLSAKTAVSIATTPLGLSARLGSPILPVAALEIAPLGHYRVAVAPPLEVEGVGLAEVGIAYGAYLRPLIERHPDQWRGWAGDIRGYAERGS